MILFVSRYHWHWHWFIGSTLTLCFLLGSSDATAQCSSGGPTGSRGGLAAMQGSGSPATLTMPSLLSSTSGTAMQYPTVRSIQMNQASMVAAAIQLSQRNRATLAAYHQQRMPARIARAQLTREKRAQRIALAKAQRESQQRYASSESAVDSTPKVTLVSLVSNE